MLENRAELVSVLSVADLLGPVFARHAYGMLRWVDLFSARVPGTRDPQAKQLVAELVADNARHMNLFRERALAHGVDPDRYRAPCEGELIYERLAGIDDDLHELAGYALGSLEHFAQLLSVYAETARGADGQVIAAVRADVDAIRERLRPLVHGAGRTRTEEAHELYRRRELVEVGLYGSD